MIVDVVEIAAWLLIAIGVILLTLVFFVNDNGMTFALCGGLAILIGNLLLYECEDYRKLKKNAKEEKNQSVVR